MSEQSKLYTVTPSQMAAFQSEIGKNPDCELQGNLDAGTLIYKSPLGRIHLSYEYGPLGGDKPEDLAADQLRITLVSAPPFTSGTVWAKIAAMIAEATATPAPQEGVTQ